MTVQTSFEFNSITNVKAIDQRHKDESTATVLVILNIFEECFVRLRHSERLETPIFDIKAEYMKVGIFLLFLLFEKCECVGIVVLSNVETDKKYLEVFTIYPEYPIVCNFQTNHLFGFFSPSFRVITPISFPFKVSPWIPKLKYFYLITISIWNCCNLNQTI